jgi:2-polyprenyl-3-methyl-5-hydroxy-6-metoxy-1,4-benzoquinol methylase
MMKTGKKTSDDTGRKNGEIKEMRKAPQIDNAKCWVDFWKSSVKRRENVPDEVQAARWNDRASEFGKRIDGEQRQKRITELLALLKKAGFTPEGASILDIGCGPGALSLPLARVGANVTSFDIASGMLDRIKETAKKENLKITTVEGSWWSADIDTLGFRKNFDLVIASSTPAIRDVDTFERMIACSKKYCYYNGFFGVNGAPADARQPLHEVLGIEPRQGHSFGPGGSRARGGPGLMYAFMYLYTLGYRPLIKFNSQTRPESGWAEAAEKAVERFGRDRELTGEQKKKIMDYYKNAAVDGKYNPEPGNIGGMMVWKIKNSS